jgi:hypothetical protein
MTQTQGHHGRPGEHFELPAIERLFDLMVAEQQKFLLLQVIGVACALRFRIQGQEKMGGAGSAIGVHHVAADGVPFICDIPCLLKQLPLRGAQRILSRLERSADRREGDARSLRI